ncbi:MAG TPA: hypothetical protein DCQ93_03995 [Bacteroidetes bacterium]|nr:hypothetical protein [Bacteroidota bacterium]
MKTEIRIVLLPVCDYDRKEHAENIEGHQFTFDSLKQFLESSGSPLTFRMYELTEFMDDANGEYINLDDYWTSWIILINP